jgi:catechol-2,3-dioxygenase
MIRPGFSFSHMGLYVCDIARMEDFYSRVLEFTVTDRGFLSTATGEVKLVFLSRDPDEHHQIVLATGRPPDVPFNVINQISLRADSLGTLRSMERTLRAEGIGPLQPVTHGNALSIYLPDPEGNRLELFWDLPWYVTQPVRMPVDLAMDDDTLMANLEAGARALPGFETRAAWRARIARRMER